MNISFQYSTHALTTMLQWIWWSFVRIKSIMADLSPFLFAQIYKKNKKIVFSGWISPNTNEYWLPILYTCINYNPPMNSVKFHPDQIYNGRLIAIFVCSNWQNIFKMCPSRWISPTPMNIFFRYYTTTHALNYNPPMNPVKFHQDQI